MDIQNYIASGILEQYVLGNTTEAESRQVEQYVREYPEIAAELDAIQASLEKWAIAESRTPRAGLEEELMKRLDEPATPLKDTSKDATPGSEGLPMVYILAGALLLALAALAYQFFQNNNQQTALNQQLEQSQSELEQLKIDCAALQDTTTTLINYASIISSPGIQQVRMGGQAIAPDSRTNLYWNPIAQKSYLEIQNLPTPPTGSQYQLWAIVDGQPVDMGVFDVENGLGLLKEVPFIENPQAFAVTLEQAGGSPTPTLDQMYVLGNRS